MTTRTSTRSLRERVSAALLRSATELAIDQRELEERLAAAPCRSAGYSSAFGAVAMARWTDSALLWLAWRICPRTAMPSGPPEFSGHQGSPAR
jgi:hypothetical protein